MYCRLAKYPSTTPGTLLTSLQSAIRRSNIPEIFLLADSILLSLDNVTAGLVVYEAQVHAQLFQELPFMAIENIIMKLSDHGISRQDAHEKTRQHSRLAVDVVKHEGRKNDMIERIRGDEYFVRGAIIINCLSFSKMIESSC